MPTKIVMAPGYEVVVAADFDEVDRTPAQGPVPLRSAAGGRVLINPAHVTLIAEEPDHVVGGPFGLGTGLRSD
jgi:hypothetical protein